MKDLMETLCLYASETAHIIGISSNVTSVSTSATRRGLLETSALPAVMAGTTAVNDVILLSKPPMLTLTGYVTRRRQTTHLAAPRPL
jgi:hypothetical protein